MTPCHSSSQTMALMRCQDISTAYLTASVPTAVYILIKTPPQFRELCNIKSPYLKIRNKSVYGLPSSGRNFWKKLCQDLRDFGCFQPCTSDHCFFHYR
mmetsp:Transcript_25048/g.82632  ORF Transcript_25048/g.82632 Transcript_25048/m.82632 type:complete len:98 (+) Transcript_25048:388-681(+)